MSETLSPSKLSSYISDCKYKVLKDKFKGNHATRFGSAVHDTLKHLRLNPGVEYDALILLGKGFLKEQGIPTAGKWFKNLQTAVQNVIKNPKFQVLGKIVDIECECLPDELLDPFMKEKGYGRFIKIPIFGEHFMRGQPDLVSEFRYKGKAIRVVDDYKTGKTILEKTKDRKGDIVASGFVQNICYAILDYYAHNPKCDGYFLRYLPVEHTFARKKMPTRFVTIKEMIEFKDTVLKKAYEDWSNGVNTKIPSKNCRWCELVCEHNFNGSLQKEKTPDF